jgi:hypothetical protein
MFALRPRSFGSGLIRLPFLAQRFFCAAAIRFLPAAPRGTSENRPTELTKEDTAPQECDRSADPIVGLAGRVTHTPRLLLLFSNANNLRWIDWRMPSSSALGRAGWDRGSDG